MVKKHPTGITTNADAARRLVDSLRVDVVFDGYDEALAALLVTLAEQLDSAQAQVHSQLASQYRATLEMLERRQRTEEVIDDGIFTADMPTESRHATSS